MPFSIKAPYPQDRIENVANSRIQNVDSARHVLWWQRRNDSIHRRTRGEDEEEAPPFTKVLTGKIIKLCPHIHTSQSLAYLLALPGDEFNWEAEEQQQQRFWENVCMSGEDGGKPLILALIIKATSEWIFRGADTQYATNVVANGTTFTQGVIPEEDLGDIKS